MKKLKAATSFHRLSHAEKESIYEECERIRPEDGESLDAKDRRRHRRAGLPVGRPKIGQGAQRINISMEKGLLKTVDAFARHRGLTRTRLIAESVQAYITSAG